MAFAIVNGEVNRVFYNGLGISIKETFQKRDGSEGAAYYTAFFDQDPGLSEGTRGKFSGLLSAKAREYDGANGERKISADIVLNSAKFEPEDAGDTPF
jgi:hypothetical protein